MATTEVRSGGVSVLGLLGVAFVVLRLCGVITWSGWLVLAPFWAPCAVYFAFLALLLIATCILAAVER